METRLCTVKSVIEHSFHTIICRVGNSVWNTECSRDVGKVVIVDAQSIIPEGFGGMGGIGWEWSQYGPIHVKQCLLTTVSWTTVIAPGHYDVCSFFSSIQNMEETFHFLICTCTEREIITVWVTIAGSFRKDLEVVFKVKVT